MLPSLKYNPIKPEVEFFSRGSDARLPSLNYNPIKPEAEFYSRRTDARLPSTETETETALWWRHCIMIYISPLCIDLIWFYCTQYSCFF